MGIFRSIGNLLKGGAGLASNFIPGGGLVKGAAGALGGLIGGGGVQGALLGGAGGLAGSQSGLSPAAIAAISALGTGQLRESRERREAAEAAANARNESLTRSLGLAEQTFADRAPLRNLGLGTITDFLGGGGGRGIFQPNAPGQAGDISGFDIGASPGSGVARALGNVENSLFGGGGGGPPTPLAPPGLPPAGLPTPIAAGKEDILGRSGPVGKRGNLPRDTDIIGSRLPGPGGARGEFLMPGEVENSAPTGRAVPRSGGSRKRQRLESEREL